MSEALELFAGRTTAFESRRGNGSRAIDVSHVREKKDMITIQKKSFFLWNESYELDECISVHASVKCQREKQKDEQTFMSES